MTNMDANQLRRLRLHFTALVSLAALTVLSWGHFHGGVTRHHIFNRADMPAISNWWGGLLLPALTWFLLGRINKRLAHQPNEKPEASRHHVKIAIGFAASLLFGLLLAASFLIGYEAITSYLFFGMLVLALFLPVFRAECVLGFVFGMTLAFGAVLPILIGSVVATLSALVHYLIRPVIRRAWALLLPNQSSTKGSNRSSAE